MGAEAKPASHQVDARSIPTRMLGRSAFTSFCAGALTHSHKHERVSADGKAGLGADGEGKREGDGKRKVAKPLG
jgi:hypothetical protein